MSIAVVIPTFKRLTSLRRALDSVSAQTLPPDVVLVSDDDANPEVAALCAAITDIEVAYVASTPRRGLVGNWNFAVRWPSAELVALLEDDNYWHSEHLEHCVAALASDAVAGIAHCGHEEMWTRDNADPTVRLVLPPWHEAASKSPVRVEPLDVVLDALSGGSVNASTVVFRRGILDAVPAFDERFIMGMDTLMWTRIAVESALAYVPSVDVTYTYHDDNASRAEIESGRAVAQARGARRLLLREMIDAGHLEVGPLETRLLAMAASAVAPIVVLLGHPSVPRAQRRVAMNVLRQRPELARYSRHLVAARLLGSAGLALGAGYDRIRPAVGMLAHRRQDDPS